MKFEPGLGLNLMQYARAINLVASRQFKRVYSLNIKVYKPVFLYIADPNMDAKKRKESTFDPRKEASTPKRTHTWETTTRSSVKYTIPRRKEQANDVHTSKAPDSYPKGKSHWEGSYYKKPRGLNAVLYKNVYNYLSNIFLITDPRLRQEKRRAKEQKQTKEVDNKEKLHYLKWVKNEAIPTAHKNIRYYEKLANTIRHDIYTSEEQLSAARAMNNMGGNIDVKNALKLRAQMDTKLVEVLVKLDEHKNQLKELYRKKGECESNKFFEMLEKVIVSETPRSHVPSRSFSFTQDVYKRQKQQQDLNSQQSSAQGSTSVHNLAQHPILSSLSSHPSIS